MQKEMSNAEKVNKKKKKLSPSLHSYYLKNPSNFPNLFYYFYNNLLIK